MKRVLSAILSIGMMFTLAGCGNTVAAQIGGNLASVENEEVALVQDNELEIDVDSIQENEVLEKKESESSAIVSAVTTTSKNDKNSKKTPFQKYGKLHVEGAGLADKKGNTVQLKGVSSHGLSWFPEFINYDAFKTMRDEWGIEVVRLAMYTAEYNGYCTGDANNKKTLEKKIDNAVKWADKLGLYVIIDWHILQDQSPAVYQKESKKFFNKMSKKYKDHDNIFYEVCNEPNGATTWATVKKYAETIINVIRKNDKDAIVIVGSPTWSQDVDKVAANPIKKKNVCYSLHYYAATHGDWLIDRAEKALKKGIAIFVTEYSICDASGNGGIDKKQADKWEKFKDKYGISSCIWSLSNKNETSALIKSSSSKKYGWKSSDLSDTGKWFVKKIKGSTSGLGNYVKPEVDESGTGDSTADTGNVGDNGNTTDYKVSETADFVTNNTGNYSVTAKQMGDSWPVNGDGYATQYSIILDNNTGSDISNYKVKISFKGSVSVESIWCGSASVSGKIITISPESYNSTVVAGGSLDNIGLIVKGSDIVKVESIDLIK